MVDLPQVSRQVVTSQQPQTSVSQGDIVGPYSILAHALSAQGEVLHARGQVLSAEATATGAQATALRAQGTELSAEADLGSYEAKTAEHLSRAADEIAKPLATRAGTQAVTRDENGNLQVQRFPIIGDAAVAYDRAMRVSATAQAENEMSRADAERRLKFPGDPQGYLKASDEYTKGIVNDYTKALGPEVGAAVKRLADSTTTESYRSLLNQKTSLDLRASSAKIEASIEGAKDELFALANGGDTSSPEFKARVDKIRTLYGELTGNPLLAYPKELADFKIGQLESELRARGVEYHVGEIYDKQGPEAAVKAAHAILTDPSLKLSPGQRDNYYNRAIGMLNQRNTADNAMTKAAVEQVKALNDITSQGLPVPPERLAAVEQIVKETKNPQVARAYMATVANMPVIASWRKMSPLDLQGQLGQLEQRIQKDGADEISLNLLATGHNLLKTMRKEVGEDPLGWANKTGVMPTPPMDFKSPDDMRSRVAAAEAVAQHYGITPSYLRPEEKEVLKAASAAGGQQMLGVAQTIATGFGDRAPRVLAEISKDAPALAHMGGLLNGSLFGGGSASFANDVAQAIELQRNEETKKILPKWATSPSDKYKQFETSRAVDQYGSAFVLAPNQGMAAAEAARNAFTTRAMRNNYDPTTIDQGGEVRTAYNRALQEAAGAVYGSDGTRYGGIVDYGTKPGTWFGSNKVLVPSNIRADRFKDVVGAIRDDDLEKLAVQPMSADGKVYKAADIKNAVPVAVPGGYRFAQGDPTSDSPKWIRGADGNAFVLNMDNIEPVLRQRVPGAFNGGH